MNSTISLRQGRSGLQLLQPHFGSTPSDPGPIAQPIPDDILADAVRRLRLVCAVWMVLWAVAIIFNLFYHPWLHLPVSQFVIWSTAADVLAAGCILVSALVYHFAPKACRRPDT
ncbi:MAG TPA: hypothetical protein VL853_05325, partial [Gemmatimonadales bacterium]|nr:hypothetical protein [Gemmatimonadales bacterium]